MRNGRTRGDRFGHPLLYLRRSRQRKGLFSIPRIASFFLSMVKHVVKPNSQQNKKPCKPNVYKVSMVGVTGFEPAASWSRTKRSTELSHTPIIWFARFALQIPIGPKYCSTVVPKSQEEFQTIWPPGRLFFRYALHFPRKMGIIVLLCNEIRRGAVC